MDFSKWLLSELTFPELYKSTVNAFPSTTKRQHAIDTIEISDLTWIPYKGVRTLFVKGLAQNENKEYKTIVLFKNVKYHENKMPSLVSISTDAGHVFMERMQLEKNDILLRCTCPDFKWRFNYFDHVDKSLYGRKRAKYEAKFNPGSANPQEMPGMCKHLIKMMKTLIESGLIK